MVATSPHFASIASVYEGDSASAAWILCDRHDPSTVAYRVVDEDLLREVTYGELREDSSRLAAALKDLGVGPGTRVATLLGKGPELITTMVATWRLGAVYVPLFTAFASPAIAYRLRTAGAEVVVTDAAQRPKLTTDDGLPLGEWKVVVVGDDVLASSDIPYRELTDRAPSTFVEPYPQGPDGAFVHIFTSGTTGSPKGVIHPLRHIATWHSYLTHGLGVTADDVYWCAADPGWAYGLYSGVVSPLAAGVGTILQTGSFEPRRAWSLITRMGVTNLTAAPTVYRAIRNAYPAVPAPTVLRRLSSAGEPLTPEVNEWAEKELALMVHDHFGQTEVGMVFANHHHPELSRPIVAGSMGHPLPGWSATILAEDGDEELPAGEVGRVALDASSPAMTFRSYQDPSKTSSRFAADGRYYLLGDLGSKDEAGAFRFSARDDDVIIMAGYRIGPFEVESVLSTHPAVAESAAVAAPDAERGEVLEAFVVLRDGYVSGPELASDIQAFVKRNYAAHAYPRTVHFVTELPKTPSGKIQRFVLRQRRRDEYDAAAAS
ncbi:AMP-binding protein [Microbacterium sp. NPDC058062]|uniref:AMP-binding protein n=1 Tax=Microbacterium sp. NPDC058062 TaxID=3346320 RepID=UPI0036DAA7E5